MPAEKIHQVEAINANCRAVAAELARAREAERRKIAVHIHDDSLQSVIAVGMRLEVLSRGLDDPAQRREVDGLRRLIAGAVADLRGLLLALDPGEIDDGDLATALQARLESMVGGGGPACIVEGSLGSSLSREGRLMLYRTALAAATNAQRHARARCVRITFGNRDGGAFAQVSDDGCGFDPAHSLGARPGHLGLAAISGQIEAAGGSLLVESAPGSGTVVYAWLPVSCAGEPPAGTPAATASL